MALFAQQAKEVDIIITTALIRTFRHKRSERSIDDAAGKPAPKLILKEHVEAMRRA